MTARPIPVLALSALVLAPCASVTTRSGAPATTVESGPLVLEMDGRMWTRIPGITAGFEPSEYIWTGSSTISDFTLDSVSRDGRRVILTGSARGVRLEKRIAIEALAPDLPGFASVRVSYRNSGGAPLAVAAWMNHAHTVEPRGDDPPFWSFQGGSYESRPDWVLPLSPGFSQANFQGMNAADYGGGVPVTDVWRRDAGLAVGHVETTPRSVALPVSVSAGGARVGVRGEVGRTLQPGETIDTLETFVARHQGDYFQVLRAYSRWMERRGVKMAEPEPSAYEPLWCAWGYERDFTIEQIAVTLPKVKELGLSWAVLDDGWQIAEGDWRPNPAKFPRGDEDMKALVARIHAAGLKARLWWAPLAADPGVPIDPDLRVRDSSGQPVKISWWDADYLCPVHPKVRELTAKFVAKALGEWGFDGLKIDGQHLNGSPLCHHPKHGHARPEESAESVPGFFEAVYRSARETKPHALLELCPCGATASFYNMPWMNQAVSSDPESSWQIRLKAKTFKALIGPSAAYHGDHVELSEGQRDFASTVGVGGVIGTKFTSPLAPGVKPEFLLTPEKEKVWRHWIQLSRELDLPRGQYRGELYDLGYDRPEAHVIEKGGELFYAFYGASHRGKVALRGLAAGRRYALRDYANGVDLGSATGPEHEIEVSFTGALLVRATP